SQAEQARGDAEAPHAGEGKKHRKRNRERDDQSGAEIAQEDEEHGDDKQPAFKEIPLYRIDDVVDQFRSVVDSTDLYAGRQRLSNFLQLILERPSYFVT